VTLVMARAVLLRFVRHAPDHAPRSIASATGDLPLNKLQPGAAAINPIDARVDRFAVEPEPRQ
jgi:hypothetical protein